jgi:hypothetical protein
MPGRAIRRRRWQDEGPTPLQPVLAEFLGADLLGEDVDEEVCSSSSG